MGGEGGTEKEVLEEKIKYRRRPGRRRPEDLMRRHVQRKRTG